MESTFTIHCDTTELDAALEKMSALLALTEKARASDVLPAGTIVATIAAAAMVESSRGRLSRRGFLGLGWKHRETP